MSFIRNEDFQKFRRDVDAKVLEIYEASPGMARAREIFEDVQDAAVAVIERSQRLSRAEKDNMIRRIRDVRFKNCDALPASTFGDRAYLSNIGGSYKISVCPGALSDCQSDFCLVQYLGHEIAHLLDPCEYSSPTYNPTATSPAIIERTFPLNHILSCVRRQNGSPAYQGRVNTCDHVHLGEGFSDHIGSYITAEFFKNRNPRLSEEDFHRGYANAFVCREGATANNRNRVGIKNYPNNMQRIRLIMRSQPVRQQMGCERSQIDPECSP